MIKNVRVAIDDILFDAEDVGEMLTDCLQRHHKMKLIGACQVRDVLIVSFEDSFIRSENKIVIAPLTGLGPDEVTAEIAERYEHGFLLRASFRGGNKTWGLFELEAEAEE